MSLFAKNGNENLTPKPQVGTKRDSDWFKEQLRQKGVCSTEIVWGNYVSFFLEIPAHLMDLYLLERPKKLHKEALEEAKRKWAEQKSATPA